MYVCLKHDEPDARRCQLPCLVVEVRRGVPKRCPDEETVENMQHQLRGGEGGGEFRDTRTASQQQQREEVQGAG